MKAIQCAHPSHHYNGTMVLWRHAGYKYIYIYIYMYIYIYKVMVFMVSYGIYIIYGKLWYMVYIYGKLWYIYL